VVFHSKKATAEVKAWHVIDSPRQPVIAYSSFRVYEADQKIPQSMYSTDCGFLFLLVCRRNRKVHGKDGVCARDRTLYQSTATQPKARRKLNFKIFFKVQELGKKILVLKGLV
jgi:hypothetical protein